MLSQILKSKTEVLNLNSNSQLQSQTKKSIKKELPNLFSLKLKTELPSSQK